MGLVQSDGADAGPSFPDYHERFKAGDKGALLWVIMICAQADWRMPEWVREAFNELYWSGAAGEFDSWDDVFGKPWGTGQKRSAITNNKGVSVWCRVQTLHDEGAPIDNNLFERAGKEFGLSRSTVSQLYYSLEQLRRRTK
jgi:hypothetical protein